MKRLLALTLLLVAATAAHAQRVPVTTVSDAARAQYVLGVAALTNADFATARTHLDGALAADPSFAMAHMFRAVAGTDGRAEHLRQATTLGARASEGERQMIAAYAADQSGDLDLEVRTLTALAAQFPSDPLPMFIVANVETGRGNPAAAIAAIQRVLTADPSFAPAYNTLGYASVAAGDMAGAEQAFRDYIRLSPGHANPHDSFGEFYLNQGRLDEAQAQYEQALAIDPGFDNSTQMLARVGIERSDLRFEQAVARGDADAIAALYAENAMVMAPDMPPVQGRAAIRDHFAAMLAAGISGVDIQTVEVSRFGDVAIRRSNVVISAGGQVVDRAKTMEVWRQIGGEWLYTRDMYSSNGPAADGAR